MPKLNNLVNKVKTVELKKMFIKNKFKFIIGLVIVILLGLGLNSCGKKPETSNSQILTLKKTDLTKQISLSGTLSSSKDRQIQATTPLEIQEVLVTEGEHVQKGQTLAKLKSDDLQLAVSQAQLQLDSARLQRTPANDGEQFSVKQAEQQVADSQLAVYSAKEQAEHPKTGDRMEQDNLNWNLEKAENALAAAKLNLEKARILANDDSSVKLAELNLQKAKKSLSDSIIVSPVDGLITHSFAEVGLTASGALFIVSSEEELKIQLTVDEYDVSQIKIGQEVLVETDSDKTIKGSVSKVPVASKITQVAGTTQSSTDYSVEVTLDGIKLDNDLGLLAGMSVTANILIDNKKDVFAVETEAVKTDKDGKKSILEVVDGESPKEIPVQTGLETDTQIEIEGQGLKEGLKYQLDLAPTEPLNMRGGGPR